MPFILKKEWVKNETSASYSIVSMATHLCIVHGEARKGVWRNVSFLELAFMLLSPGGWNVTACL